MNKRILATFFVLVLVGCGAAKPAPEVDNSVSEPPADSAVVMPKGAPMVEDDAPDQASTETPAEPVAEPAEGEATVTRADLDQFIARGPSYVLTVVTVEPVHRDGQFQGYQITDVTRGVREFITPQMRVGDVVTHINGVRMLRPEDFMQAWRSLDKVGQIRIDFVRQSEPMTANWTVR